MVPPLGLARGSVRRLQPQRSLSGAGFKLFIAVGREIVTRARWQMCTARPRDRIAERAWRRPPAFEAVACCSSLRSPSAQQRTGYRSRTLTDARLPLARLARRFPHDPARV